VRRGAGDIGGFELSGVADRLAGGFAGAFAHKRLSAEAGGFSVRGNDDLASEGKASGNYRFLCRAGYRA